MVLCIIFGCVRMMTCGSSFVGFVYSDFLFVHYSGFVHLLQQQFYLSAIVVVMFVHRSGSIHLLQQFYSSTIANLFVCQSGSVHPSKWACSFAVVAVLFIYYRSSPIHPSLKQFCSSTIIEILFIPYSGSTRSSQQAYSSVVVVILFVCHCSSFIYPYLSFCFKEVGCFFFACSYLPHSLSVGKLFFLCLFLPPPSTIRRQVVGFVGKPQRALHAQWKKK